MYKTFARQAEIDYAKLILTLNNNMINYLIVLGDRSWKDRICIYDWPCRKYGQRVK
jgi:hypothetical protein